MNKQKEVSILQNFFTNLKENEETSRTEVEFFLQTYLEFIFKLNNIDISKYDITIKKVQIDEYHPKREKQFKNEPNQENRKLDKRKALTKPSYKANCGNFYFDAMMYPDPKIKTKFTIAINKNLCHAKNFDDINLLVDLFHVFGHEVHHIIQYIRHKQETAKYDYLLELHDSYLKDCENFSMTARDVRKLKRAIHRHLDILYSSCISEKYADKKGYDYLDILFNEILKLNNDNNIEFTNFIQTLQEDNEYIYHDRLEQTILAEKSLNKINQKLSSYIYDPDLLLID